MLRRLSLLTLCLVLSFVPFSGTLNAETLEETPEKPPIIITEIYSNAPGSSELGFEYIELHNQTDKTIELTGYELSRAGNATIQFLDSIVLTSGEYMAIYTEFSLINSGGIVFLKYPAIDEVETIYEYEYPALSEDLSWSFISEEWQIAEPTPSESNPLIIEDIEPQDPEPEPEDETEKEIKESTLCDITNVQINEIVANPKGSDAIGGEYIELYNNDDVPANLEGCTISTDKLTLLSLPAVIVQPNGYYSIELFNDLLNGGGTVTLTTLTEEIVVSYPALLDDQSWSFIDSSWVATSVMTPNAKNQIPPPDTPKTPEVKALEPCPEGKVRNPETNRCRTIATLASTLLPCSAGSVRNPDTNRCRKIVSSSTSSLKPCNANQERNPETNRCRKISSAQSTDCQEGYERNQETNRCRKIPQVLSSSTFNTPTKEAGIHSGVFIFMTILIIGYGIYEYRFDIENIFSKVKPLIIKT